MERSGAKNRRIDRCLVRLLPLVIFVSAQFLTLRLQEDVLMGDPDALF